MISDNYNIVYKQMIIEIYNPQIQKSGETKTKGSESGKNRGKSQFQAVIKIQIAQHRNDKKEHRKPSKSDALFCI